MTYQYAHISYKDSFIWGIPGPAINIDTSVNVALMVNKLKDKSFVHITCYSSRTIVYFIFQMLHTLSYFSNIFSRNSVICAVESPLNNPFMKSTIFLYDVLIYNQDKMVTFYINSVPVFNNI